MGKFLEAEKPHQADFKAQAPYFSQAARADGEYKNQPYPFCLPVEQAEENLFPPIRQPIVDYFARRKIKWHDGQEGKPSNHMCSSQVCCANFLFPFFDQPQALAELLRPVFPDLQEMLPIEDGQYVAFEWIGEQNYLGEIISRNGMRTRGANCTSVDAAVMFTRRGGFRQIVLIEWKYTESYSPTPLKTAPSGRDRMQIYAHLYAAGDCPLSKELIPTFESLFYEPFYQFMRQQLLAHEMEKAHELGADIVSLLHIAPAHNKDFRRVTSPALQDIAPTATAVWQKLVRTPNRFMAAYSEDVFGRFNLKAFPKLQEWWDYLSTRYPWVVG